MPKRKASASNLSERNFVMSSLKNLFLSLATYNAEKIKKLKTALSNFPPGKMRCYNNGNSVRYVLLCKGEKPKTIEKSRSGFIKTMIRKAALEASIKDCEADLALCMQALETLKHHPHAMEKLLADPNMCKLIADDNPEADISTWKNAPYERDPYYPENLKIPTEAGIYVRSKDEALCVSAILEAGFPFRYEQKLTLKNHVIYPDFTLLHPENHRIIIMELFGMMDDFEYSRRTGRKLQQYLENGYMPGQDLVCFFASSAKPLDITKVIYTLRQL